MDKINNDFDFEIFSGKKFSDLLQEIWTNQRKKKEQINELIKSLKPMITNIEDIEIVVSTIQNYLETGVKNDKQLIEMASVIQRYKNGVLKTESDSGLQTLLTDSEKDDLLKLAQDVSQPVK